MAGRKEEKLADDEFDVELLVRKLYLMVVKGITKLLYPVRLLLLRPKLLVICLALAAGVSWIVKTSLPKIYKASFIIRPFNKADLFYVNLLYDLERTIIDQDYDALSRVLKIEKNKSYYINQIALKPIRLGLKTVDTIDLAEIEILVSDITMFDTVQQLVMQYLRDNEHYKTIKRLRIAQVESLKNKVRSDILQLDSLKRQLASNMNPRHAGGFVFGEPIDPVGIYEEGLKLHKEEMALMWQEEYVDNFEVINNCVPTSKPIYPIYYKILILLEGITLLFLVALNYYLESRKK
jgi:hypothetical protein